MATLQINVLDTGAPMDLSGKRFGQVQALGFNYEHPSNGVMWLYRCDCGREGHANLDGLRSRPCCGPKRTDTKYMHSAYHGFPEFKRLVAVFNGMYERCYNESSTGYPWYGKRGITICDEWLEDRDLFIKWALAKGYAKNLTIDRRDNYKGYSETNSRWISMAEQLKNKRIHQDARGGTPA